MTFPITALALVMATVYSYCSLAEDLKFNLSLLNLSESETIDIKRFTQAGYISPGLYPLDVVVNRQSTGLADITWQDNLDSSGNSLPCLNQEIVSRINFKPEIKKNLRWYPGNACLNTIYPEGISVRADLGSETLNISIPDAFIEYQDPNWDPPSQWDNGITGVLLDYSLSGSTSHALGTGQDRSYLSSMGTAGFNTGAWRLRADWQGRKNFPDTSSARDWSLDRIYAYRPLPEIKSRLTLGQDYTATNMFDSVGFQGAILRSEDRMLPPRLRGYAPEVIGVARTNATVTVSQSGRVLVEKQVSAGPFQIQDIQNSTRGRLDIKVEEQDGSVQSWSIETANIPYLTRPGQLRYALLAGQPVNSFNRGNKSADLIGGGEFSWGISNNWSLLGGVLLGNEYSALALGIGRDLYQFGAVSVDITQSQAELDNQKMAGRSYRLSYSKIFDDYDAQVTFAGYRFSEKDFMSLSDYTNAVAYGYGGFQSSKELYTSTLAKSFKSPGISLSLSYDHQTYWQRPAQDNFRLSLSKNFSVGTVRNLSTYLSLFRNQGGWYGNDKGGYLSVSVPWGQKTFVGYDLDVAGNKPTHSMNISSQFADGDRVSARFSKNSNGQQLYSYYSTEGALAKLDLNASWASQQYTSAGFTLNSGFTVTPQGAAMHTQGSRGGSRILFDTAGSPDVPVQYSMTRVKSNRFGKAVLPVSNAYSRTRISIDHENLPSDTEVIRSTVQATLTEGAIGYRQFGIIRGHKGLVILRTNNGLVPPLGAEIRNAQGQETGIVGEDGMVWLTGMLPSSVMDVRWDGKKQCEIMIPKNIIGDAEEALKLICTPLPEGEEIL